MTTTPTLRAAVIGLGYWGPNLARNLSSSKHFSLAALCDLDSKRLAQHVALYPAATGFANVAAMLQQVRPDLVCIATPVASHFPLAKQALLAGCHVLVEKPMTMTVAESQELLELARTQGKQLFVDHTFLFTGAVQELQRQVQEGLIGDLLYVDGVRINLGLFQPDVDVIWDLAPHDLSILQAVIGRSPRSVRAMGSCHSPSGLADVAYLHLDYGQVNGQHLTAHLHLSWLSPVKVRRMIFAGTKQSIIYDDLEPAEKIKIYDHGVSFDVNDAEARRRILVSYRKGDMRAPNLSAAEAIGLELNNIAEVLRGQTQPAAPGRDGAAVVRILEAAKQSLANGGTAVEIAEG
jgi:predicted dehydrogenase